MSNVNSKHIPVLLKESIDLLHLQPGMNVVDGTLGLGGHSLQILERIGKKGRLMAFDQDEANLASAKIKIQKSKHYADNVLFIHDNFVSLKEQIKKHQFPAPDAILLDLGFSSPHVDEAERGFSFQKEGPLDMRYDKRQKKTAEEVISKASERQLADIIYHYGEEKRARVIARKIIQERKQRPIKTTLQLAELIKETVKGKYKTHPATQTFQALRIYVNDELDVLESTLHQAVEVMKKDGHIAVISYHSLEDRIVKNTFRYYTKNCICSNELVVCQCNFQKKLYLLTKRPIIPSGIEVQENPRARSAKLRVAKRI